MATKSVGGSRFVVCVRNTVYAASLEVRKIYRTLPDRDAEQHALVRIIDEPGEDYLYPARLFRALNPPQSLRSALRLAG